MTKVVVIDPGHGGYDPGAVYGIWKEKDINLTIALQLKTILEAAGVTVVMTRETDTPPGKAGDKNSELKARTVVANKAEADLFISVHVNAMGNGQKAHGAEVYVYGDGGNIHGLASNIIKNIGAVMGFHGEPIKDGSGFYVVKHTNAPAMLIEIGFIDSSDLDLITNNLHNFAGWIASPVIPWAGGNLDAPSGPFVDYAGSVYKDSIEFVKEKGFMNGLDDTGNIFGPNDNVSRGQLALILQRLWNEIQK